MFIDKNNLIDTSYLIAGTERAKSPINKINKHNKRCFSIIIDPYIP